MLLPAARRREAGRKKREGEREKKGEKGGDRVRKGGRTERKGKGGRREGERKGRRKEVKRKEGRKEREWGEETKLLAVCKCMAAITSFLCDAGLVGNRSPSSGLVANKSLEPAEKK